MYWVDNQLILKGTYCTTRLINGRGVIFIKRRNYFEYVHLGKYKKTLREINKNNKKLKKISNGTDNKNFNKNFNRFFNNRFNRFNRFRKFDNRKKSINNKSISTTTLNEKVNKSFSKLNNVSKQIGNRNKDISILKENVKKILECIDKKKNF